VDIYTLGGESESTPPYQEVAKANYIRHYDFLLTMIWAALATDRPLLSHSLIKAINFHAIVGLHHDAGQFRDVDVTIRAKRHPVILLPNQAEDLGEPHKPPPPDLVIPMVDDLVNLVNWQLLTGDAVELAAQVSWRINYIHPFVNGNGRTARALCYFILCVKAGHTLPGAPILPERIRQPANRQLYYQALQAADRGQTQPIIDLVGRLIQEQIDEVK
jgi:Fic family protein